MFHHFLIRTLNLKLIPVDFYYLIREYIFSYSIINDSGNLYSHNLGNLYELFIYIYFFYYLFVNISLIILIIYNKYSQIENLKKLKTIVFYIEILRFKFNKFYYIRILIIYNKY